MSIVEVDSSAPRSSDPRSSDMALGALREWLTENWDPDLCVADWWERLGSSGWAAPGLPENAYGKGMSRSDALLVQREIAAFAPS